MAARVDVYAIDEGEHLETWDADALEAEGADRAQLPDLEGFVSAADDDEEALFEVLGDVAEHTGLDARTQGAGTVRAADVAELATRLGALADEEEGLAGSWLASLAATVGKVAQRSTALGWRTRYDQGGSTDAGAEEFPTAWS